MAVMKVTAAEKLMYQAIFQASACLALGNLKAVGKILSDAMTEINRNHTQIAQATFGLIAEEKRNDR